MNYLSIGGKSVIKNDQSKLTRWDVIIYDMEVPEKPFKDNVTKFMLKWRSGAIKPKFVSIRVSELCNILKAKYISSKSRRITGMPYSGFQRHCVAELIGYYYIIGWFKIYKN